MRPRSCTSTLNCGGEGGTQTQSMHLSSRAFISHLPESESDLVFLKPFVPSSTPMLVLFSEGGMRIVIAIDFCILLMCRVLVHTASAQVLLHTPGSLLGSPCPLRTVSRDGPALDQQGVGSGGAASAPPRHLRFFTCLRWKHIANKKESVIDYIYGLPIG